MQGMEPIESLKKIVADRGIGVLEQPELVESLLFDYCESRKPEIYLLVSSLKEAVPQRLMAVQSPIHREAVKGLIREQMQVNLGMLPEKAEWTVNAWLKALPLNPALRIAPDVSENELAPLPFWKKAIGHTLLFVGGAATFGVTFTLLFVLLGCPWGSLHTALPVSAVLFFGAFYGANR